MGGKRRTIEIVRALAGRQHGVVARSQLVTAGLGPDAIDALLSARVIDAVHRGTFAFGPLLTREGRWMAAVLASGPGAVLSHRSAASLWRIRRDRGGPVEVTTPRKLRRRPGITPHRLPLAADELTIEGGIPVTTPARTIFDIAHESSVQDLERAMREADYLKLAGGPSLPELLARYPGRTGARSVRELLAAGWSAAPTRSELEARFAAFVERHGLPRPQRNAFVELGDRRIEVDFLWRRERLVVELDGYRSHSTRHAFEVDRERDRRLQLAGFVVVRVTWRQLGDRPAALAADLRDLLVRSNPVAYPWPP